MLDRLRPRLTYANVMATVAVFVALGGSAYAGAQIHGNQLVDRSVGGWKMRDDTLGFRQVKESVLGPVPKANGLSLWATVGPNGSLIRGSGVVQALRSDEGRYRITFNRNVGSCAYLATPDSFGPGIAEETRVGLDTTAPAEIVVETRNSNGSDQDSRFHVAAIC